MRFFRCSSGIFLLVVLCLILSGVGDIVVFFLFFLNVQTGVKIVTLMRIVPILLPPSFEGVILSLLFLVASSHYRFPPLNLILGHFLGKPQLGQAGTGHVGMAAGHGFEAVSFSLRRRLRWANVAASFLLPKPSSEKKSGRSTW